MKSYAHNRERIGPLPYLVQAAPRRQPADDLGQIFRMAAQLAALFAAGAFVLKLIGVV
jgi:hypothetical protein